MDGIYGCCLDLAALRVVLLNLLTKVMVIFYFLCKQFLCYTHLKIFDVIYGKKRNSLTFMFLASGYL